MAISAHVQVTCDECGDTIDFDFESLDSLEDVYGYVELEDWVYTAEKQFLCASCLEEDEDEA